MRPFLKWAGNKYQILEAVKLELPRGKRLIEPFVGSGAIFLNVDFPKYLLSDSNPDLIELYSYLQKEGDKFIRYCRTYFGPEANCENTFYERREKFNHTKNLRQKSALFVYLNRHCYNGLCRYNSRGKFNAPFGRYLKPYFPSKEMAHFSARAKRATFVCQSFEEVFKQIQKDDVFYCDPPYVPLSATANFTSYAKNTFGEPEQLLLASLAERAANQGAAVVLSNHATPFTHAAYRKAKRITTLPVQRYISCSGKKRGKVLELLAIF